MEMRKAAEAAPQIPTANIQQNFDKSKVMAADFDLKEEYQRLLDSGSGEPAKPHTALAGTLVRG